MTGVLHPGGCVETRCGSCDGGAGVGIAEVGRYSVCESCRRRQALEGMKKLGASKEERARRAMEYAKEHGVDLATAYLARLGIRLGALTTEAAIGVASAKIPESGAIPHVTQAPWFDPEFGEAVEKGYLTPHQAFERGNRTVFAEKLSRRYDIKMDLAVMVADNRLKIEDAIEIEEASTPWHDELARPQESSRFIRIRPDVVVTVLILAALCGSGIWLSGVWSEGEGGVGTAGVGAGSNPEFRTDESGALTQVLGPNPRSVLEAFCSHPKHGSRFELETVVSTAVPNAVERIGVFKDRYGGTKSVIISRDPKTRRWQIGSGRGPIALLNLAPPR